MPEQIEILKRRLEREKLARKQAESILEAKAQELYEVNQSLERIVKERTIALEQSEKKYRSIVESAADIIYNIDANGNFSFVNPAGLNYTGYISEEVIGKSFTNIIREDHKAKVQAFYLDVLNNQKAQSYFEFPIITKKGETLWIGQNVKLIQNPNGVISFSVLARDITERIKLGRELQEAKLIAENAQRAEAEFLASMSHEMRTPLNAIIGMTHLLQDAELNKEEREFLSILFSSADVLQRLISDVLDISKIDAGKLDLQSKPFDLIKLLKNLERTFAVKLEEKNVTIRTESDVTLTHLLLGDELIINQIFLNLLGNAEKFTKLGEIIIHINQLESNDQTLKLRLGVSDTGIGMDQEQLDKIFEQFKQASAEIRQNYGGTGLGLAITKKLISLLDSEIVVESQKDKGTKFFFDLVFQRSSIPVGKEEELYSKKLKFSKLEFPVLIVEDNAMNQKYITRLMQKWNLDYELAHNGLEAVNKCKTNKYSLIFMDLQMPIMDGYEATNFIRTKPNQNKEIPIIALTASTLLSKKQHALNSGMSDFLSKPFNPKQLSKIILSHLPNSASEQEEEINISTFVFNKDLDIQYLEENYGDDLEYCQDIMETFLESVPVELEHFDQAIKTNNFLEMARIAHKLKPTFQMVGYPKLTKEFEILELDAKIESKDAIKEYPILKKKILKLMKMILSEKENIEIYLSNKKR